MPTAISKRPDDTEPISATANDGKRKNVEMGLAGNLHVTKF